MRKAISASRMWPARRCWRPASISCGLCGGGETVRGEARAGFGQPVDGFNRLARHVAELRPNVIFLNYGLNESYAGPAGLTAFESDLAKLLEVLTKDPAAAVVVFSIMEQE